MTKRGLADEADEALSASLNGCCWTARLDDGASADWTSAFAWQRTPPRPPPHVASERQTMATDRMKAAGYSVMWIAAQGTCQKRGDGSRIVWMRSLLQVNCVYEVVDDDNVHG